MEKKETLKITAAILTHSVVSHLPPGTLTPVRLPDQVSKEVLKIYENMYNSLKNSDTE
ncbi:MAG: hypothetical protein GTN70_09350 [Deltaproteobacteria bacterium]|nr:hypothetical protein [Deltaproteobacteria bacterium]NIS77982.1 hypothetical protein [Deltaproteobacteria bacterium]